MNFHHYFVILFTIPAMLLAATVSPIEQAAELTIHLSDYRGQTFFEVMTQEDGLRDKMNQSFQFKFSLPDFETVASHQEQFSKKVWRSLFEKNKDGIQKVLGKESSKDFSNQSLNTKLSKVYKVFPPWGPGMFLSLLGGASTLVHLNKNTYYYNAGYDNGGFKTQREADAAAREGLKDGEKPKEAVGINSGRSYAAGPSHAADDASYPDYLKNLRGYYLNQDNLRPFFEAILSVVVSSDASKLDVLDKKPTRNEIETDRGNQTITIDGQTLVADFMAVYTAELYRHLFAELKKHDWENALSELTFVSAYSERAGLYQNVDGKIVSGNPSNWRYVGELGSGIGGKAGIQRRNFQTKVCNAARKLGFDSLKKIDAFTLKTINQINPNSKAGNRDCFKSVMVTLNHPDLQKEVKKNAQLLLKEYPKFLQEIRERHEEITEILLEKKDN